MELAQDYVRARRSMSPMNQLERSVSGFGPWVGWGVAAVLFVVGWLLFTRPLTSAVVAFFFWGAVLIVYCVTQAIGIKGSTRNSLLGRVLLGVAVLALVAFFVLSTFTINWLSGIASALLLISALVLLLTLKGTSLPRKIVNVGAALASFAIAVSSMWWPDLTLVVVGYVFALWFIISALKLAAKIMRGEFDQQRSSNTAPPALAPTQTQQNRNRFLGQTALATVGALALVFVGLTVGGVTMWLHTTTPRVDSFYSYDTTDLPVPGTLLRVGSYGGETPEGMVARKILFTTTDSHGKRALASGVIAVPQAVDASAKTPLVLWTHGTKGVAPACSPSVTGLSFSPLSVPAVDQLASNNWAMVAPDMMSLDVDASAPYLIGQGEASIALDAVRAAQQLSVEDLFSTETTLDEPTKSASIFADEVTLWGHSQGGHSALWAAQYAGQYAPEVTIAGTAALAPAATPSQLNLTRGNSSATLVSALFSSYVVDAYSQAYADVSTRDLVRFGANPIVDSLSSRCLDASMFGSALTYGALGADASTILKPVGESSPLVTRLAENAVKGTFTQPVFLGWGSSDEAISAQSQQDFADAQCAAGTNLTIREYQGNTHMGVLGKDSALPDELVAWTADRFAGKPVQSSCES